MTPQNVVHKMSKTYFIASTSINFFCVRNEVHLLSYPTRHVTLGCHKANRKNANL